MRKTGPVQVRRNRNANWCECCSAFIPPVTTPRPQADVSALAAKGIKSECEAILADAIPALNAAVAALDTIKAADIRLVQVGVWLEVGSRGRVE